MKKRYLQRANGHDLKTEKCQNPFYEWSKTITKMLYERRENEDLTANKKVCRKSSLNILKQKAWFFNFSKFSITCFTKMDNLVAISYTHKKAAPNAGVKQIWL